jgi:hypothetical protein
LIHSFFSFVVVLLALCQGHSCSNMSSGGPPPGYPAGEQEEQGGSSVQSLMDKFFAFSVFLSNNYPRDRELVEQVAALRDETLDTINVVKAETQASSAGGRKGAAG